MLSQVINLLQAYLSDLTQLDINSNLLFEWESIAVLGKHLPMLQSLNISKNKMLPLASSPVVLKDCFQHVRELVLNYCNLSWKHVELLEPYFPKLEELHLCYNGIGYLRDIPTNSISSKSEIPDVVEGFQKIKFINLEGNRLSNWTSLQIFSKLPLYLQLIV
jgi:Leucine-rich repeat (LRR) protein